MAQKWTLNSSTTAGDRLLGVGAAAIHLSTGDLVMLVHDPATADPNSMTLQLVPETAHTTPSVIATLNAASSGLSTFVYYSGAAQALSLCRDASDNLYVLGPYGGPTPGTLAYQAFVKQPGLNWVPAPANAQGGTTPSQAIIGCAAIWCNTGGGTGGAGHLLVVVNESTTRCGCIILDAGRVLTGRAAVTQSTTNPHFLGVGVSATAGSNIDLASDGFGANSGLAISAVTTTLPLIAAWGVSSSGILTTGGGAWQQLPSGTLSATTKLRVVRFVLSQWAAIYPSSVTAGALEIASFTSTGYVNSSTVDTTTVGNFPQPSATLSWDVTVGYDGTVWIYGWSSAANTTMLRVPITFPGGIATLGAAVTDDTSVGTATNTTIRTVKQPVDYGHVDWQGFHSTSAYSLLGDFSALPTAPNVPTLLSPANGAVVSATSPFSWLFSSPLLNDAQVSYYLRFQVAGGGYRWWNGSSLTTAQANPTGGNEVAVTSGTSSSTPTLTASTTFGWAVQVVGASGVVSGYSLPWTVTTAVPPSTPTLTASYDAANNRAVLTVAGTGTDDAWFQFSDDGGTTWVNVFGATAVAQVSGAATAYDWWIPANATRSYRVLQFDPSGIPGNYSAWSSTQTATSVVTKFWLRDAQAGTLGINPHVLMGTLDTSFNESLTEHQIPGRSDAVIVADVVGLEDGGCTFFTNNAAEETALMALVKSQRTLLFQTPDGRSFFTRWNVPRPTHTPYLVATGSYREHALTFRGQKAPPS